MKVTFSKPPPLNDPRWGFAAILLSYNILGMTVLGFNRAPHQVLLVVLSTCILDMLFHFLLRKREILFPLSSFITGLGLGILANYSHGGWTPLIPVILTVASKYLITFNGKHIFNPNMFGVGASLLWGQGLISASPSYQWGGSIAIAVFIVTAAYVVFLSKIKRNALILSFLGFYTLALALRSYLARFHVPPETLFLGAITSPAFYLFAFFMITDPKTSPSNPRHQILMSGLLVLFDLLFHLRQTLSTFFLSGMLYFTLKLVYLHAKAFWENPSSLKGRLQTGLFRYATVSALALPFYLAFSQFNGMSTLEPNFQLTEVPTSESGLRGAPGDILQKLDPQIAHIGKWLLSVGDAIATADIDGDGLMDVFLTNTLKANRDRATLYRNLGDFKFEEVTLPMLDEFRQHPESKGIASGAVFFDFDNDGDKDLYINVSFGNGILLRNDTRAPGAIVFQDITNTVGLSDYTISIAANATDINKDGRLDLIVMNAINPYLPGYPTPHLFNIFKLPSPEYEGDRRMVNVMHQTWHNAHNGGPKFFYINMGTYFKKVTGAELGLDENRWSLDFAFGDLNNDGYDDLYVSNDFGPDELYINHHGNSFEQIRGNLVGKVGRDTYKGMNTTLADFDNNETLDIYVSNVHERLQAEGSLLYINNGRVDVEKAEAFTDQATQRAALNERRFGWGASATDINRDGFVDILQANGHVDDAYDKKSEICEDFWYWNEKIALTPPEIHGYADSWADLRGRCIFPKEQNRVYLNNHGKNFVDVAEKVGWNQKGNSRGIATVDLNNDGDLDILVTHMTAPTSLYRNQVTKENSWLALQLIGDGRSCNTDAIGTKVKLLSQYKQEMRSQFREVQARNGFSSQNDIRIYFGIPKGEVVTRLEIAWCGGKPMQYLVPQLDRYHKILQGKTESLTARNE